MTSFRVGDSGEFEATVPFGRRGTKTVDFALDAGHRPVLTQAASEVAHVGDDYEVTSKAADLWVTGQIRLAKEWRRMYAATLGRLADRGDVRLAPVTTRSEGLVTKEFAVAGWNMLVGKEARNGAKAYRIHPSMLPPSLRPGDPADPADLAAMAAMARRNEEAVKMARYHVEGCPAREVVGAMCLCRYTPEGMARWSQ